MTRATFVKKARNDIWQNGKPVVKTHGKGKNAGQKYEARDRSQPENKQDVLLVKKGESYYHWSFRFGPMHISKTAPKRSQLTQSEWLSQFYQLEEEMAEASASSVEELESLRDDWLQNIESMRDEAQDRLDNMPEGLRENSNSGQTLQEYVDALENWMQELEGVDLSIDEEDLRSQATQEVSENGSEEDLYQELVQDKVQELLEEMQSTSSGL